MAASKILLVDDIANIANIASVTASYLSELGYEVKVACDGVEALEATQRLNFDAMILDVEMPAMTG